MLIISIQEKLAGRLRNGYVRKHKTNTRRSKKERVVPPQASPAILSPSRINTDGVQVFSTFKELSSAYRHGAILRQAQDEHRYLQWMTLLCRSRQWWKPREDSTQERLIANYDLWRSNGGGSKEAALLGE